MHDYPALSYPHVFVLQVGGGGGGGGGSEGGRSSRVLPPFSWRRMPALLLPCVRPFFLPGPLPLQGGYKAFWRAYPELCLGGYTPMDHPDFQLELKVCVWGGGWGGWGAVAAASTAVRRKMRNTRLTN